VDIPAGAAAAAAVVAVVIGVVFTALAVLRGLRQGAASGR
jgi:hypothetical protein